MEPFTGGCLCGAVRFEIRAAPYRVGLCHCMDCRKSSGAIFSSLAIFPAESATVTGATAAYTSGSERRHFCPTCGSPLFGQGEGSDEIEICIGALDTPNQLTPTYESWTVRREAWLPELPLARHYAKNREGQGRTEP